MTTGSDQHGGTPANSSVRVLGLERTVEASQDGALFVLQRTTIIAPGLHASHTELLPLIGQQLLEAIRVILPHLRRLP